MPPGAQDDRSDADLIAAARLGDRDAWGTLFARHNDAVNAVARYYSRSTFAADDLTSEAFERTMAVIRSGGGPDVSFRAYIYTVVRRLAFEAAERERRVVTGDPHASVLSIPTQDPAANAFEHALIAGAFEALPKRWQAVLWYSEVERLHRAAVGRMLGLAPNAVSALAFRAREGLREQYIQQHLAKTTPSGECRTYRARLGTYLRARLPPRDSLAVDAHLAACENCAAVIAELEFVGGGMRVRKT
jgi:RNA polymerase sigma factor (sigma-70 family)